MNKARFSDSSESVTVPTDARTRSGGTGLSQLQIEQMEGGQYHGRYAAKDAVAKLMGTELKNAAGKVSNMTHPCREAKRSRRRRRRGAAAAATAVRHPARVLACE